MAMHEGTAEPSIDIERALRRPLAERAPSSQPSPTVVEIADLYLADLRRRAARTTIRGAERALRTLIPALGVRVVSDITLRGAHEWRQARCAAGASNRTANYEIGVLKASLNHAVQVGILERQPLEHLRSLPTTARYRRAWSRALTEAEIVRVMDAARRLDAQQPSYVPQAPLLRAMICTGARWMELTRSTWGDWDAERRVLTLRAPNTKTQAARAFPVDEALAAEMERLRRWFQAPGDRIFLSRRGRPWKDDTSNFLRWLYTVFSIAGVVHDDGQGQRVNARAMRHTFITRLARHGVPIAKAQVLSGHKSVQLLLATYTHLAAEEVRGELERLPAI